MGSIIRFFESTMLLERLTGVVIYALVLLYYFDRIRHAKSSRTISRYLNHYLIILCIMAFFYIPGRTADLSRWRSISESWKNASFSWFWNAHVLHTRTPVGYLLIYLCQVTKVDGLLPMVCALGFYGNLFHIFKCEAKREDRTPDSVALVLLFFMSRGVFVEVISGIRCLLAFSIVLRCAYDEMYEKKGFLIHIPFYLIAVLLHNAALPLVAFRLLSMLFEKKKSYFLTIMNVVVIVITSFMAVRYGSDYIDAAFRKANSYVTSNKYTSVWEYVIAFMGLTIIVSIVWKLYKRYPQQLNRDKNSIRFLLLILIFDLVFIGQYSIFHRYFTALSVASVPALGAFFVFEHDNGFKLSRKQIELLSLIILLIACIRGNLCGYKFFLLS